MEERTQIKFSNPDIDGTTKPQLITLEQETPIEGVGERDDGETFTYHKWLCTNLQYFMASASLDAMLKSMPDKLGKPLKIEKVVNPKGGFPFFQINGLNNDAIAAQVANESPPQPSVVTASNTDGSLARLEDKLDKIINLLSKTTKEEELPF